MVAVIMSIYKNDKLIYVAQCVDSLLKQTFKDFHVYVQYDGVVESGIEHFFMELMIVGFMFMVEMKIMGWHIH